MNQEQINRSRDRFVSRDRDYTKINVLLPAGTENFLPPTARRLVLRRNQPSIQSFPPRVERPGREATSLHLVLRLRMNAYSYTSSLQHIFMASSLTKRRNN